MELSKAHDFMVSAMNSRATRQKLISGNLSNVDTPFYKARDIAFEKALSNEAKKVFSNENGNDLELANTNGKHLGGTGETPKTPTIFIRDGHGTRNDGNNVDLDVETTEMSKNSVMFKALVSGLRKESNIFRSVVSASEKLN
ncbi:Flagellar hook-basal body complex protein FlgB [Thiovulum sp. ES]|nr:Flagellar hook-basal body complex protein FlgB [Thiovulum sp. ES]